jgi:rSAM/selenodomain-associated transferase 2
MISIIIPTLNEEKTIANTIKNLKNLIGDKEIIVVDGGSSDNTVLEASKYVNVVKSKMGRSFQMNTGANIAKGDILWFVHSDSIIQENSLIQIENAINKGYIGGGFHLYFYDLNTKFMKFVQVTSNMRGKFLKLIYGDQGIFVRKDVFERLGGFPQIEIMEDWEFSLRIKKHGKTCLINTPIGTSARRFKKGGELKTLLLMHKLKILYTLGVSPKKLVKIYREAR